MLVTAMILVILRRAYGVQNLPLWRVGNELSINPRSDKWITVNGVARGLGSSVANDNLLLLNDHIDANQGH